MDEKQRRNQINYVKHKEEEARRKWIETGESNYREEARKWQLQRMSLTYGTPPT